MRGSLHPLRLERLGLTQLTCIGDEKQLVEVVCDAATILDLCHHVPHSLPGGACSFLGIHLQKVVLQAAGMGGEGLHVGKTQGQGL